MKHFILPIAFFLFSCGSNTDQSQAFVPESSGNLNHITVVMPENDWKGALGEKVRDEMGTIYEGLPLD